MTDHQHETLLEQIADNVAYVRGRVDNLDTSFADLRVSVEHRITKLEVRAAMIAALVSAVVGVVATVAAR